MRSDVLGGIGGSQGITNAIILTHNIDFVFVQTVVLSVLRRCGNPTLTIFADAECATQSYAQQAPVLHGLGVRYRVVPVEMSAGFRFHPKAVLLSGASSATLFVGSGNLTFGGWRENAEAWVRFDTQNDGIGPFGTFLRYLNAIIARVPLADAVRGEIEEAFDSRHHAWAVELLETADLVGRVGEGPRLLDQMVLTLGSTSVERVTICSPYFDEEAEALSQIRRQFPDAHVRVLVQAKRTGLTESGWGRVAGADASLGSVEFTREDDNGNIRRPFVHAKFYAFESAGRVRVFAGSANCSRAALTVSGHAGNAELLATTLMSAEEFEQAFDKEFVVSQEDPSLASSAADQKDGAKPGIRILGASYDGDVLLVAFSPSGWRISRCLVDGVSVPFEAIRPGLLRAQLGTPPRRISLEGTDGVAPVCIGLGWVDHERELRSSAWRRNVAEAIRQHARTAQWGIGAWGELLDVFCEHLRYMPTRHGVAQRIKTHREVGGAQTLEYSRQDVFAGEYDISGYVLSPSTLLIGSEHRISSLQQLLLRWFGIPLTDPGADEIEEGADDRDEANEEDVDRQERLPPPPKEPRVKPTAREVQHVEHLVVRLCEAITNNEFLRMRRPEDLAADLKLASALLRIALREEWLAPDKFFETTHRIWSALFFEFDGGSGWLQRRYEEAPSPDEFADAMRSDDLVAALSAWALAVPHDLNTPLHARFALAAILPIARLPWLWDGYDYRAVGRELADLLLATSMDRDALAADTQVFEQRWILLIRRGHALRRLEEALRDRTPLDLLGAIKQAHLVKGELLWQGSAGFCVADESATRSNGVKVPVLRLQGKPSRSVFAAHFTVPMRALLDEEVLPLTESFGMSPRQELAALFEEVTKGFGR